MTKLLRTTNDEGDEVTFDRETGEMRTVDMGGWSSSISYADRQKLRAIVRKVHLNYMPAHLLTNLECDKLIDAWGPVTGEIVIKKALKAGL